jgi:hypothetical protein
MCYERRRAEACVDAGSLQGNTEILFFLNGNSVSEHHHQCSLFPFS